MAFDIRHRDYTFKHAMATKPDLSADRYKEHFHTTYEFLFFVTGDADFMLQHTRYTIRPGSLLIAKPGEYHNIIFKSTIPYDRYVIRFDPHTVYPYVRKQLEKAESVYYIDGSLIAEEFFRMDRHMETIHKDVQLSACIGALNIIITHLISAHNLIQKADYINVDSKQIVDYIDDHLSEIHSADDIAGALHMSKSAIYKIFSKQFDASLMSYIRTQKCMMARSLLGEGRSATEVANQLGFNHYSSFYRDYQQVFHESPSGDSRKNAS